jgi:hypothetical protein
MMKAIIFAVLLTVMQTAPPVPRQATNTPTQNADKVKKNAAQDKQPIALNTPPADVSEKPKRDEASASEKAAPNTEQTIRIRELPTVSVTRDWADWILWFASALLAAVAIVGIGFAYFTLKAIQRQTEAVINSERAWILGTPSLKSKLRVGAPHTGFVFVWSFKNVGRTPARLVETDAASWRVENVRTIPESPKYEGKPMPLNNFLLVPNDSIGFGDLIEPFGDELTREEIDRIREMKLTLIAYGYVIYLDQFEKKHTARFCHTYMVGSDSEGFRPYWSAPSTYTECD